SIFAVLQIALGSASQLYIKHYLGVCDFPGITQPQPFVSELDLPALFDGLSENAEFVADPVTKSGNAQRCQRVQVAGGQAAQTAVAQTRLVFLIEQRLEVQADLLHR